MLADFTDDPANPNFIASLSLAHDRGTPKYTSYMTDTGMCFVNSKCPQVRIRILRRLETIGRPSSVFGSKLAAHNLTFYIHHPLFTSLTHSLTSFSFIRNNRRSKTCTVSSTRPRASGTRRTRTPAAKRAALLHLESLPVLLARLLCWALLHSSKQKKNPPSSLIFFVL